MTALIDQRVLAVGLGAVARSRGGFLCGTAAQLLALCPAQANWAGSALEMEARGLPELAARPGLAGVTVTRAAGGEWDPKMMRRMAIWEIRAEVLPAVAAQAPPPSTIATAPREAARLSAPAAGAQPVELLRAVPSSARRDAANAAAWAAVELAANELVERGGPAIPMARKIETVQAVFVSWLNADPSRADENALSAARQALSAGNPSPPPRAA